MSVRRPVYICPHCRTISRKALDARERYCRHCRRFADDQARIEAFVMRGVAAQKAVDDLLAKAKQ